MKKHSYIMMVDDDHTVLNLMNRVLDFEGYNTPSTAEGKAVLSLLEESKPNLVMLDITMPELDSLQVRNLVQGGSRTPVIMLTGRCELTTLQDTRLLGGDIKAKQTLQKHALLAKIVSKLRGAPLLGYLMRN